MTLKTTKELLEEMMVQLDSHFSLKERRCLADNDISIIEVLEKMEGIFKAGLSPFTVLEIRDDNDPVFLLTRFMDSKLTNLAFKYVTKDMIESLSTEEHYIILNSLIEYNNFKGMDLFFQCGFRLTFGEIDTQSIEWECAKQGYLEFFEILQHYQPEYKFNMSYYSTEYYTNFTLTELIDEVLQYVEEEGDYRKKLENVRVFINTNFLYEKLQKEIENKTLDKIRLKI